MTRAEVVAEARSWIGTPFVHQGRMRGVGVDCVGLLIGVARSLGLVAPAFDLTGYPASPDGRTMLAICGQHMTRVESMQPGDVIVVRWARDPQHVGILGDYLYGGLSMIHANGAPNANRVEERRLDEKMLARFVAAYSLPRVA